MSPVKIKFNFTTEFLDGLKKVTIVYLEVYQKNQLEGKQQFVSSRLLQANTSVVCVYCFKSNIFNLLKTDLETQHSKGSHENDPEIRNASWGEKQHMSTHSKQKAEGRFRWYADILKGKSFYRGDALTLKCDIKKPAGQS